jgi:hypothetical protein
MFYLQFLFILCVLQTTPNPFNTNKNHLACNFLSVLHTVRHTYQLDPLITDCAVHCVGKCDSIVIERKRTLFAYVGVWWLKLHVTLAITTTHVWHRKHIEETPTACVPRNAIYVEYSYRFSSICNDIMLQLLQLDTDFQNLQCLNFLLPHTHTHRVAAIWRNELPSAIISSCC